MAEQLGKVYLVGGGPGDPGLITLRGCQCLARADVVLYDYLVNPQILAHTRAGAELVCLGRHGQGRIMPQVEINERMILAARAGQTVVRLKGGDPVVFAHAAEEIAALAAAGVTYELVPGVTAAIAVGSYAGIPLTHRDEASAVALVAAQEREGKSSPALDYRALAAFPGTLVFYMGVTTARVWTGALIEAGKSPETPAAIVRRCSWPDQYTVQATLGTVAGEIERLHLRPPGVVVVGPVAALAETGNWFVDRPLFGVNVLVTRAAEQAPALVSGLEELGAHTLTQPVINITPPEDWRPLDQALGQLDQYDWLVFSSANGVESLLGRMFKTRDLRALGKIKLAAIGPGSAEVLARYHLRADVVPDEYRAEALADALLSEAQAGRRFLLARASRGREVLCERLVAAGGRVDQVVVYKSTDVERPEPEVASALAEGRVDWVTVTSSAIARSLVKMFGRQLARVKLASISPLTTATLAELGFQPAAEARQYTMAGLIDAIARAHHNEASA